MGLEDFLQHTHHDTIQQQMARSPAQRYQPYHWEMPPMHTPLPKPPPYQQPEPEPEHQPLPTYSDGLLTQELFDLAMRNLNC